MVTRYTLHKMVYNDNSIIFHPERLESLGLVKGQRMTLCYGIRTYPVTISTHPKLNKHEVILPKKIIQYLRIPLSCSYEIYVKENMILVGPFIGFLVSHSASGLERYNFQYLNDYLYHYNEIGGTVIAFSLEGVNHYRKTIEGYFFNPIKEKWEKGTFGYPSSFFIKSNMISPAQRKHFQSVMGNTIFNNFNLNKWEMHRLLESSGLGSYLPPCKLYTNPVDIVTSIKKYQQIYIKPIYGSRGRSIVKVSRIRNGTSLSFRENRVNHTLKFSSMNKLKEYMSKKLSKDSFLIQKDLNLISINDRIVDFRLIMVKNERGKWENLGLYARFGPRKSIVSNISAGGNAQIGEYALQKIFQYNNENVEKMKREMTWLAHTVARSLDAAGVHCGNMGVDLGIDKYGKLWIIEIQHNNPDHTLLLDANDPKGYLQVLRKKMLYLKWLAGFPNQS